MSWDQGQAPRRRAPVIVAGIVLAVLAIGFLTRQTTPSTDTLEVETDPASPPAQRERPDPPPSPSPQSSRAETTFPAGTGLTLWAIRNDGDLTTVNLDTRETATASVLERRVDAVGLEPLEDGVVVVTSSFGSGAPDANALYVAAPGAAPVALGSATRVLPSASSDRVWMVDEIDFLPGQSPVLREVTADGTITQEVTLPPGVHAHAAFEDGLLLNATGTLIIYDPQARQGRRVGDGSVAAADGQRFLRRVCDEDLACRLVMGTAAEPDAVEVPIRPEVEQALVGGSGPALLSPDGRWIAYVTFSPDSNDLRVALLDVATGDVRQAPPDIINPGDLVVSGFGVGFTWDPSGQWLFFPDRGGGVAAWDVQGDQVAYIDLGLPGIAAVAVR